MNTIDFEYFDFDQVLFCKLLKMAKTLVLIKVDEVITVRLILEVRRYNKSFQEFHDFHDVKNKLNLIRGTKNLRTSFNIENNLIKKILKPKSEFHFKVWADSHTNQYVKDCSLHSDSVRLIVGDYEMLLDVTTVPNNSARIVI